MSDRSTVRPVEILLIEDSPSDADLAIEALGQGKILNNLHFVEDGVEAIKFLRRKAPYQAVPRPDLILLDLNLPKKSGVEVLEEIKTDPKSKINSCSDSQHFSSSGGYCQVLLAPRQLLHNQASRLRTIY